MELSSSPIYLLTSLSVMASICFCFLWEEPSKARFACALLPASLFVGWLFFGGDSCTQLIEFFFELGLELPFFCEEECRDVNFSCLCSSCSLCFFCRRSCSLAPRRACWPSSSPWGACSC